MGEVRPSHFLTKTCVSGAVDSMAPKRADDDGNNVNLGNNIDPTNVT